MKKLPLLSLAILATACGGGEAHVAVNAPPAPIASSTPIPPPAPSDPLGPRPTPEPSPAFQPPAPTVYTTANGITVWLLERHALPVVAVTVVVPSGAASDPKGKAGVAHAAADMLDEGAGKLGAIEFSKAVDQLGAHFTSAAGTDSSYVGVGVVKRNFAAAMQLLGDAVVRPRFDAKEWKRVHDLWLNDLKERAAEPREVAHVVERAVLYGADHPYGHPVDGFVSSATAITLADAKKLYTDAWRPDRATIVVVGDVTRAELDPQIDAAFGAWKKPQSTPPAPVTPPAPPDDRPKVVLVDRPDAPQSILAWVRPGLPANDPRVPPLDRANIALGGSFTSRLNQDLREAHGWSYGAASHVQSQRGVGFIVASAGVVSDKTADALKALLADLDDFSHFGLKIEEVEKTRRVARNELVEGYQTVDHASFRLAADAALGLGPDYEAKASVAADAADRQALSKLASTFYDRSVGTIVIVGPRASIEKPITDAGFTGIAFYDAEGKPVKASAPPAAKPEAKKPEAKK